MRNVKCADCAEYINEWCSKVIDSPHPDMLRDCQYFHEKDRDLIKVTRCKDCRYFYENRWCARYLKAFTPHDYCSYVERKEGECE